MGRGERVWVWWAGRACFRGAAREGATLPRLPMRYVTLAGRPFLQGLEGASAGARPALHGAINRCVSYFCGPAIRASLLNGELPYKWEIWARNRIIGVITERRKARDWPHSEKNIYILRKRVGVAS